MICDKVLVPKIGGKKNNFLDGFGMNELIIKDDVRFEDYIFEIRGKQVVLDKDLAYFYDTETRIINQAVRRNKDRFPEDFCFQLTQDELQLLYSRSQNVILNEDDFIQDDVNNNISRSQSVTLNKNKKRQGLNIKYLPYAFTEQGVAMLSSFLKTNKAIKMSIAIMNAFVGMRRFISDNLLEQRYINNLVLEHDNDIKLLKETFSKFDCISNEIFYDGQIYDAYSLLLKIIDTSKKNIIVIDNYVSKELLDILSKTNKMITIYSKNIDNNLISKYNSQYSNVTFKIDNRFHDRFIIIDERDLYHCGASFKDLGKKCFAINMIKDEKMIKELLSRL